MDIKDCIAQIESLRAHHKTSYAQCEEDIILLKFLSNVKRGRFVDVGCAHPVLLSASYMFYELGWRGVNIDPRQEAIDEHQHLRPEDRNICIAASNKSGIFPFWERGDVSTFDSETAQRIGEDRFKKREAQMAPLTEILNNTLEEQTIHFMKIDVEKHEREVLEGLDLWKYRPWVMAVECTLPCTETPCWNDWERILFDHGYRFAVMHRINRYYLAAERYDELMGNFLGTNGVRFMKAEQKQALELALGLLNAVANFE